MKAGFVARNKYRLAGTVAGGFGGYLYYSLVGCNSGSCLIASNPLITVPYFALLGYLLGGIVSKK